MSEGRSVLLTGATGLVGGRLVPVLRAAGLGVRALSRSPEKHREAMPDVELSAWDGVRPPGDALADTVAVVHLAGEPVLGGPLTAARRERIRASRIDSTRALVDALSSLPPDRRPGTLVCASAVGYYGDAGEEKLDEKAPPGEGFLAEVCRDWEEAAAGARELGVVPVSLRIGIVLAREGGALELMARVFRLGLGGKLGDGRQWVPWIHVRDLARLALFAIEEGRLDGPVNAVAPNPVRNVELTRQLARALSRPAIFGVPRFALRMALGELASELLGSRRAVPSAAQAAGFRFESPELEDALSAELSPR